MKTILAIIKVSLYMFFAFILLPGVLTLIAFIPKVFHSIIIESGKNTPVSAEIIVQEIFAEQTFTSFVMYITMFNGIIVLLLIGLFFRIRHKKFTQELKICKMRNSDKWFPLDKIKMLILVGIAANFLAILITNYIPYPQEWILDYTEKIDSTLIEKNIWLNMLFAVLYAGIFEELFFRGLIYTRLKNGMNKTIAACLSAVLFGLIHASPIQMIYATMIGLIFVYVFEKFESVIPCIVIHMTSNFVGVIMSTIPVNISENYIFIVIYFIVMSVITIIATKWLLRKNLILR